MDAANDESTSLAVDDEDDAKFSNCISHAQYALDAINAQHARNAIGADPSKLNPTRKTTKATARLWHRNL